MTPEPFWRSVTRGHGCCEWSRYRQRRSGYGQLQFNGRTELAHRVAWMLTNGPIPEGQQEVLHSCDNPPCCRPDHLFLGDQQANMDGMIAKGRMRRNPVSGNQHPARLHPERMARGERQGSAKLTEASVGEIRQGAERESQSALARAFGVSKGTIRKVVLRITWAHVQ